MSMPPIPWRANEKILSEFSEAALFCLGMVLAPLAMIRGNWKSAAVFWGLAVLARLIGLVRPSYLRPIFVGLMVVTWPVGWVVSNFVLALVYYGVVTPIGLILRWRGRNAMGRGFDRDSSSYWKPCPAHTGPEQYFRLY